MPLPLLTPGVLLTADPATTTPAEAAAWVAEYLQLLEAATTAPTAAPSGDWVSTSLLDDATRPIVIRWLRYKPANSDVLHQVIEQAVKLGYRLEVPATDDQRSYLYLARPDGQRAGLLRSTTFMFTGARTVMPAAARGTNRVDLAEVGAPAVLDALRAYLRAV